MFQTLFSISSFFHKYSDQFFIDLIAPGELLQAKLINLESCWMLFLGVMMIIAMMIESSKERDFINIDFFPSHT